MSAPAPAHSPPRTAPQQLPTGTQATSFSTAGSADRMVLKYALNNISADSLHAQLLNSVDKLLPAQAAKLNQALESTGLVLGCARAVVKEGAVRHCLRCHRPYLERENGKKACVVLHYQPVQDKRTQEVGRIVYPCCGVRSHIAARPSECFRGRHTTVGQNVNYGLPTVKTCEQVKCFAGLGQA